MNKKAVFLIVLLATFGLQCRRNDVSVSDHHERERSADSAAEGTVRLSAVPSIAR